MHVIFVLLHFNCLCFHVFNVVFRIYLRLDVDSQLASASFFVDWMFEFFVVDLLYMYMLSCYLCRSTIQTQTNWNFNYISCISILSLLQNNQSNKRGRKQKTEHMQQSYKNKTCILVHGLICHTKQNIWKIDYMHAVHIYMDLKN
jgi:hypothetical protein